jgi:hypothetical protein
MLQHYYVFKFFFQNPLNMILENDFKRESAGRGVAWVVAHVCWSLMSDQFLSAHSDRVHAEET